MSNSPAYDTDGDIGLGDEDKGRVQTNQIDWYKGEKGRTDRVALLYFNTYDANTLRKLMKQKPDTTDAQKKEAIEKVRAALATKLSKTVDQLDPVDLLDLSEPRFKALDAHYKDGFGFVNSRLGKDGPDADKVWLSLPEKKTYVTSILLMYPTNRDGDLEKERLQRGWQVKPWRFDPGKFDVIRKINKGLVEGGSSVAATDLLLTCTDTGYQKITITQSGPAIYLRNEAFKRVILTKALTFYNKLNPFRELSTEELREKLGMGGGGGGGASPGSDISGEDFTNILSNV